MGDSSGEEPDLDITGDGVGDQLDGGDEETAGKHHSHRHLVVQPEHEGVRRVGFHLARGDCQTWETMTYLENILQPPKQGH